MITRTLSTLFCAALLLGNLAAAQPAPSPAHPATPAGPWSFGIRFLDDAPVSAFEWELELKLETADFQAVFDHYEDILLQLGFTVTERDADPDEIEARYRLGGLEAELEVEQSGRFTEVELEIEGRSTHAGGLFAESGGLNVPLFPAPLTELEWEVELKHDTRDVQRVFRWYDEGLRAQGWPRTDIERDSDETQARYVLDGMRLELEVELDDGRVEVEFELEL